jgi:hypothetical protein
MKRKICAALILSLNVTFALAANQAFGGSSGWGPFGGLNVDVYRPDDIRFTCTYDIPWDWVHRCPPVVSSPVPPPPPVVLAPGCRPQAVTAPGPDGKDQTITMVRC